MTTLANLRDGLIHSYFRMDELICCGVMGREKRANCFDTSVLTLDRTGCQGYHIFLHVGLHDNVPARCRTSFLFNGFDMTDKLSTGLAAVRSNHFAVRQASANPWTQR